MLPLPFLTLVNPFYGYIYRGIHAEVTKAVLVTANVQLKLHLIILMLAFQSKLSIDHLTEKVRINTCFVVSCGKGALKLGYIP